MFFRADNANISMQFGVYDGNWPAECLCISWGKDSLTANVWDEFLYLIIRAILNTGPSRQSVLGIAKYKTVWVMNVLKC